ncbi:KRI1-like family/KRI1-like family C-terminal, putative [Leishmania tarentolae]|uniref:KRI1-like family/KRI1-like family C-terminal, putative n=1 Tax=Leishmania tarentolae TaxID=5689 RepID=A0A640KU16_LEITA|nr:KRI1-like family/KRI1-like family C-terminal, putative [Leishmania tarentolae]
MPPTASSSSASAKVPHRIVFDSDDSSSSDGEGPKSGGNSLAREMTAASERERRKNPHAESGRARPPRAHPLAPSGVSTVKVSSARVQYKAEKKDLFGSDSSSDVEAEETAKDVITSAAGESNLQTSTAAPPVPADVRGKAGCSASKTAHVQGLSLRRVQEGEANGKNRLLTGGTGDGDEEENSSDEDSGLHINKAYAARYEEQKRKQELHMLTEKYKGKLGKAAALGFDTDNDQKGEEDSSDDEEVEEDDEAVLLTRENNLSFAKALLAVRKATVPLCVSGSAKKSKAAGAASSHDEDTSSSADPEPTAEILLPKEELLKQRFFPPAEDQIRMNTDVFERRKAQKRSKAAGKGKFTLADEYKRSLKATAGSEDAVVDDSKEASERDGLRKLRPQNAEEANLRAAFLRDVESSTNAFEVVRGSASAYASAPAASNSDEDSADEDKQQRGASEEEKRLLEEAFSLSMSAAAAKKSGKKQQGASGAGTASSADNEADNEAFLRDFFIQELWRPGTTCKKRRTHKARTDGGEEAENSDGDAEGEESAGSYYSRLAQLAHEEEDEAFFNNAEVWEREYQEKKYRHQEAEEEAANGGVWASHVQTFPRPIGEAATGLLRKPDTTRKDARQRRRERAEAAHAQQIEELKRLKHLKRKEIEDQRALIASVAGLKATTAANFGGDEKEEAQLAKLKAVWSDKDLDAPFDPAEFDRKMAQLFDGDYYDEKNVDEDEIAYFDEELDKESDGNDETAEAIRSGEAPALFSANSLEEAQSMMPAVSATKTKKGKSTEVFFRDDFGPSSEAGTTDAISLLYPSEALQHLEKERQQLNDLIASSNGKSETDAELMERLQASLKQKEEEYYQLHRNANAASSDGAGACISGGFRYREVPAEDFTLSIEEILALDDRQLNIIAPMNCYASYLDKESNERDRRRIERRRQKGFRQVDSDRTSRRYGNVKNTALLNPEQINDEEGTAIAENLSKRLRDDGEDPDAPLESPNHARGQGRGRVGAPVDSPRDASSSRGKWPRTEAPVRGGYRGRGSGRGSFYPSVRRGRGGQARGRR